MSSTGKGKNTFSVEVEDEAGNLSTQAVKDFYLSADLAFSIFNDNNLYYLLGGIAIAATGFIGFLAFRRKRKLDEEDRLAMEQAELLFASGSGGSSGGSASGDHSTQVEDFVATDDQRVKLEDILPASAEIISASTGDVPDGATSKLEESYGEDDATTILPEDQEDLELQEDNSETTVIPEDSEDLSENEVTDVISDEDEILEGEDDVKPTDVLPED